MNKHQDQAYLGYLFSSKNNYLDICAEQINHPWRWGLVGAESSWLQTHKQPPRWQTIEQCLQNLERSSVTSEYYEWPQGSKHGRTQWVKHPHILEKKSPAR